MTSEEQIASENVGKHYLSSEFQEAMGGAQWEGLWPVVDRHGLLTGEVVDLDNEEWLNVGGEAAIYRAEAEAGGWRIDEREGFAYEPRKD